MVADSLDGGHDDSLSTAASTASKRRRRGSDAESQAFSVTDGSGATAEAQLVVPAIVDLPSPALSDGEGMDVNASIITHNERDQAGAISTAEARERLDAEEKKQRKAMKKLRKKQRRESSASAASAK